MAKLTKVEFEEDMKEIFEWMEEKKYTTVLVGFPSYRTSAERLRYFSSPFQTQNCSIRISKRKDWYEVYIILKKEQRNVEQERN